MTKSHQADETEQILELITTYRNEVAKIYSVIGEFLFIFQNTCESIKTCVYKGLEKDGLVNIDLARNIFEHNTAYSLISSFRSFYCDYYKEDVEGQKIVGKLLNRLSKINEIRNDIVHGNLNAVLITGKTESVAYASGRRLKASSKGIKNVLSENHLDGKKYEIGYFDEKYYKSLIKELQTLNSYFSYIGHYLEKSKKIGSDLEDKKYITWQELNKNQQNYLDSL